MRFVTESFVVVAIWAPDVVQPLFFRSNDNLFVFETFRRDFDPLAYVHLPTVGLS